VLHLEVEADCIVSQVLTLGDGKVNGLLLLCIITMNLCHVLQGMKTQTQKLRKSTISCWSYKDPGLLQEFRGCGWPLISPFSVQGWLECNGKAYMPSRNQDGILLPQTKGFQLLQVFHKDLMFLLLKHISKAGFSFKWCKLRESGPPFHPFYYRECN